MPFRSVPSTPTAVLGDDLIRVFKLLHTVRQHAPRQHPAVDPMAYPMIFQLASRPMRVSDLAEVLHTDVSTVSRQVSTLVDHHFVTRGPDPDDRRAQALTLSDEGKELLTAIRTSRDVWLQGVLADWPDTDVRDFSTHLQHFASDLEASLTPSTTTRNDR